MKHTQPLAAGEVYEIASSRHLLIGHMEQQHPHKKGCRYPQQRIPTAWWWMVIRGKMPNFGYRLCFLTQKKHGIATSNLYITSQIPAIELDITIGTRMNVRMPQKLPTPPKTQVKTL